MLQQFYQNWGGFQNQGICCSLLYLCSSGGKIIFAVLMTVNKVRFNTVDLTATEIQG